MDKKILLQNLADSVAERTGITKRKAETFVRSFFEITEEGLLADGIVKIKGFGTTKIVAVGGRESVNINTGERFQIEGHDKISFTPDAPFRDLVNRPFAHFATTILADNLDEEELAAATLLSQESEPVSEEDTLEAEEVALAEAEVALAEEEETLAEEEEIPVEEEEIPVEEDEAPTVTGTSENFNEDTTPAAPFEDAAQAEDHLESTQPTETPEDMQQPIIIQNTIPESRPNWWRLGFVVLATLVLMTLSYLAGYYRVFCPCEWQTPIQPEVTEYEAESDVQAAECSQKTEAQKTAKEQKEIEKAAEAEKSAEAEKPAESEKANAEKTLKDAACKYRQMDGEYLITGVIETHEMKVGDNLYKLARQAYGEKSLATYIIFHNQISNPDLVQLGQKIEIPQLTKK